MKTTYEAQAGVVDLSGLEPIHNEVFGYTLFEEVVDPENPDGPRAIAMHVPARSMSKAWQLVEPNYSERMELLDGSAKLFVADFVKLSGKLAATGATVQLLTKEVPIPFDYASGHELQIGYRDVFCVLTEDEPAVVLSRPSKDFDISFEQGLTEDPTDYMARFILKAASVVRVPND